MPAKGWKNAVILDHTLHVPMDKETLDKINETAKARGIKRTVMVRDFIERGIKEWGS